MGRHLDEGPRGSGVQVIFVSEVAHSATVLHQPLIEPDDVKWRLADKGAATVLNRAAQADIVRAFALRRVLNIKRLNPANSIISYEKVTTALVGWHPKRRKKGRAACSNL